MVSLSIVLLSENYVPEVMDCAFLRASWKRSPRNQLKTWYSSFAYSVGFVM
jgi:hypothetical protein